MTCRELTEFLDAYLDGDLPPGESREFQRHLAVCEACVLYLDSYRKTIELGRRAFDNEDHSVTGRVPEELVQAILAARGNSR